MKKLIMILICVTALILIQDLAWAGDGFYIRGSLGYAHLSDVDGSIATRSITNEFDPGLALGIAAGYEKGHFRGELEGAYQKDDYDKVDDPAGGSMNAEGDMTASALLFNLYYDFLNSTAFTPFVSAGIGLGKIEVNDLKGETWTSAMNVDDTVLACQLSAGVEYSLTEKLSLDLTYRYLATDDPEFEGEIDYEFSSHNLLLGLRYVF